MNDGVLLRHARTIRTQTDNLRIALESFLAELADYEKDLARQPKEARAGEGGSESGTPRQPAARTPADNANGPVPAATERRRSPRRKCMPVPLLLSLSRPDDGPQRHAYVRKAEEIFPGWVVDASEGGLGILTCIEIPEGTLIVARPKNAPARCPWVEVEVRYCRRDEERWLIGCRFRQELLIEDLDLFRRAL